VKAINSVKNGVFEVVSNMGKKDTTIKKCNTSIEIKLLVFKALNDE